MAESEARQFPEWESFYTEQPLEKMPWYHAELDPDLAQALDDYEIPPGYALDLGTGPGTQAVALNLRGFGVTATDLSETAVRKAEELALRQPVEQPLPIDWRVDDILNSQLDKQFDLIFDRGCFHVLPPEQRPHYVSTVKHLLKPQGYFFLKCFSRLQPGEVGPYRFTQAEIATLFAPQLQIHAIHETTYQGQFEPWPKALFCVMQQQPER